MFDDNGLTFWKSEEEHLADLEELGLRFHYGCAMDKIPESCHSHGTWYKLIKRNLIKAQEIYEMNCKVNRFSESCLEYALGLISGDEKTKDEKAAYEIFKDNCDERSHDRSCYGVGQILDFGVGQPSNINEALKYYEKSCELGYGLGCARSGWLNIADGRIPNKDPRKGLDIITKACDSGKADACKLLAKMYEDGMYLEKNLEKSKEILKNMENMKQ